MRKTAGRRRRRCRRLAGIVRQFDFGPAWGLQCMRRVLVDRQLIGHFFDDWRGVSAWGPDDAYLGRFPSSRVAVRALVRNALDAGLI